jgi:hypothetical protein
VPTTVLCRKKRSNGYSLTEGLRCGKIAEYGKRVDFEKFGTPAFPMTWGVQNHQNFDWDSIGLRDIGF